MSLILKYDLGNPHRLPVGYTPLAYIESTGTLYIDTTCLGNSNTSIILDYIYTELVSSAGIIGTGRGSTTEPMNGFRFYYNGANKYYISCNSKLNASTLPSSPLYYAGERYHTLMNGSSGVITTNGVSVTVSSYGAGSDNTYSLMLFKAYSTCCKAKLYKCTIILNGLTIRDFIPAKNSSGVVGLFDCASQTFFTNQGTGSFIAGPEVVVLPYEYLLVEYLHSDGNQYINTGYIPGNNNLVIDMIGTTDTNAPSTNRSFYGGASSGVWNPLFNVCNGHWEVGFGGYWAVGTIPSTGGYYITKLTATNGTNQTFVVNGETLVNNASRSYTATNGPAWYLFKINNSFPMIGAIHYMKITENGTVVREYIPCYRRSDLKPGMYDTVNNVFYTNSGSGEFILGPVVEESSRQLEYNNAGSNYIGKPTNVHHSTSNPSSTLINWGSGKFIRSEKSMITTGALGISGDANFSISAWVKTVDAVTDYVGVVASSTYSTGKCYSLLLYSNKVSLDFWSNRFISNNAISTNTWHHVVVTKSAGIIDNTHCKIYVDGVEVVGTMLGSSTAPNITNSPIIIGRLNDSTNRYFNGEIYDVRIYNNVLTTDEVLQIYKRGL